MSRNYPSLEKYVCIYLDWSIPTSIKSQRPLKRAQATAGGTWGKGGGEIGSGTEVVTNITQEGLRCF